MAPLSFQIAVPFMFRKMANLHAEARICEASAREPKNQRRGDAPWALCELTRSRVDPLASPALRAYLAHPSLSGSSSSSRGTALGTRL